MRDHPAGVGGGAAFAGSVGAADADASGRALPGVPAARTWLGTPGADTGAGQVGIQMGRHDAGGNGAKGRHVPSGAQALVLPAKILG